MFLAGGLAVVERVLMWEVEEEEERKVRKVVSGAIYDAEHRF